MRPTSSNIRAFIDLLVDFHGQDVFNPWNREDPLDATSGGAARRCERLAAHLACDARIILVGEAPSYQGCHFSGIPFTSERLILEGAIPRVSSTFRISTRTRPWSEPSATIVWGALREHGMHETAVLWNTFAWHPHQAGNLLSNRTPTSREVEIGAPVLRALIGLYPGVQIVPVGRIAAATLQRLGVQSLAPVRHPARGGAGEFRTGLKTVRSKLAIAIPT